MDGIERAIRNALDKGDANDRAFRERVYRSAFAALERTLAGKSEISEETRQGRRDALKAKVYEIETEYVPAMAANARMPQPPRPAVEPTPPPPRTAAPVAAPPGVRIEPRLDAAPERRATPSRRPAASEADLAGERDDARVLLAGRRSWTGPVLVLLLLVALAAGGWWVWQSGLVALPEGPPEPQLSEPATSDQQGATPPGQIVRARDDDSWIRVFDPADPATVTASGDAIAAADEQDGAIFIQARSGASGAPVRFGIGEGALQTVAGTRAVFRISASADEEEGETQITVECDFAALGDCGRRRYLVGITQEDFLFEVQLPNANPGGAGAILVNSDIENQGRSVRIHSISVAPAR
ncbi:MAG: hypothetical protein MEQ84_01520 [Mesorhizobium sp.]|nr:hypothetical protein [Mesorhizobium sp.]